MWGKARAAHTAAKTARAAWRRVPADVRAMVERDADAGRAATDLAIARVAAAYARTRLRWMRRLLGWWALSLPVLLAVGVAVGNLANGRRGGGTGFATAFSVWAVLGVVQSRRARHAQALQQLGDANQIAVDGAAHRTDTVALAAATERGPEVVEVRRRRTKALIITVVVLIAVPYPLVFAVIGDSPAGWLPYTLTGLGIVVLVVFGATVVRDIRHPVVARFTEAGWELPPYRLSGTWDQIEAITVRTAGPLDLSKLPLLLQAAPRTRGIVLTVADVKHDLQQVPWHQRGAYRLTIRAFGAPTVIPLDATIDTPADDIVATLRRHTDAPRPLGITTRPRTNPHQTGPDVPTKVADAASERPTPSHLNLGYVPTHD